MLANERTKNWGTSEWKSGRNIYTYYLLKSKIVFVKIAGGIIFPPRVVSIVLISVLSHLKSLRGRVTSLRGAISDSHNPSRRRDEKEIRFGGDARACKCVIIFLAGETVPARSPRARSRGRKEIRR